MLTLLLSTFRLVPCVTCQIHSVTWVAPAVFNTGCQVSVKSLAICVRTPLEQRVFFYDKIAEYSVLGKFLTRLFQTAECFTVAVPEKGSNSQFHSRHQ